MKKRFSGLGILFVLQWVWASMGWAQDPCGWPGKPADAKRFEKILSGEQPIAEKISAFGEVLENPSESGKYAYELGLLLYRRENKKQDPSFGEALNLFKQAESLCPSINPLLYYYLGVTHYAEGNLNESLKAFESYLSYAKNPSDPNHEARQSDVKRSLEQLRYEVKMEQRKKLVDPRFAPQKLSPPSTAQSEYLPVLSPDNAKLLFTRKVVEEQRGIAERKYVEYFSLSKQVDAANSAGLHFDMGTPLPAPFNQGGNYGGAALSLNGKEMVLTVCIPSEDGYKNCDLFYTQLKKTLVDTAQGLYDYRWQALENLGPQINGERSWESQPTWGPDSMLIFAKFGDDTKGIDLYYTYRLANGTWGAAQPIAELNTDGQDKAPFLHSDGISLYFSTSGRKGEGGFDVFKSVRTADGWGPPTNAGIQINTNADEHGLLVSADGKYAIYSSNTPEDTENYDIYYMELPEEVRPEEIILITGRIDGAGSQTKVMVKDTLGKVMQEVGVSADDGAYAAVIRKAAAKSPLLLSVEQEGAAFEAAIVHTDRSRGGVVRTDDMSIAPVDKNKAYTLRDILFKTNSAELEASSLIILSDFSRYLLKNPQMKVEIRGHTDNQGDAVANQRLSVDRALAVKSFLIGRGIPASRMSHAGFGDTMPVATNANEAGRAKNRRTEFVVM
ncbi:MAG TPA: OmpA family protein [Luteibaculaceae bacterium]|nr:OmpA family protein [Luteibaculaceae bacterium]